MVFGYWGLGFYWSLGFIKRGYPQPLFFIL